MEHIKGNDGLSSSSFLDDDVEGSVMSYIIHIDTYTGFLKGKTSFVFLPPSAGVV